MKCRCFGIAAPVFFRRGQWNSILSRSVSVTRVVVRRAPGSFFVFLERYDRNGLLGHRADPLRHFDCRTIDHVFRELQQFFSTFEFVSRIILRAFEYFRKVRGFVGCSPELDHTFAVCSNGLLAQLINFLTRAIQRRVAPQHGLVTFGSIWNRGNAERLPCYGQILVLKVITCALQCGPDTRFDQFAHGHREIIVIGPCRRRIER